MKLAYRNYPCISPVYKATIADFIYVEVLGLLLEISFETASKASVACSELFRIICGYITKII